MVSSEPLWLGLNVGVMGFDVVHNFENEIKSWLKLKRRYNVTLGNGNETACNVSVTLMKRLCHNVFGYMYKLEQLRHKTVTLLHIVVTM